MLSTTKSVAEGHLTKLKDLCKVTTLSKYVSLSFAPGKRNVRDIISERKFHTVCVIYTPCLFQKEFWDQLKWFEEELSSVSQLVVESLLKEHEQKLSSFTGHIQHLFNRQLKEWEDVKVCIMDILECFLV